MILWRRNSQGSQAVDAMYGRHTPQGSEACLASATTEPIASRWHVTGLYAEARVIVLYRRGVPISLGASSHIDDGASTVLQA